ncbi:MFS transporter [Nocardia terpenica]|uniref:MFS transporter n=1 Tax=Nocardia terpenica TaxID=455432 RepID=UPI001893BCE1|nr:MFS transporter [Nocardia terpenica]MBF6061489.1 MFS transporter [Nocardia terpenica]MBF6105282.1 MFS transporter [Nocardia terpenica]MBF6113248.1 MFS transporter [Nocardia terpenica]MBF6119378.1 MFS transporter [Nocardia terpenica]MBF6153026.1 MFS transporter [Nocardia terpenica]
MSVIASVFPPVLAPDRRALLRRLAALAIICLAELLVLLDNTVVNVALPSLGVQLNVGFSGLQWVVDAYTLTFSGFLLACGYLGDRFGRRKVMMIGLAGVAVMSLGGALATNLGQVLAARAAMGVFAAAVFPATLALITNLFPEAKTRGAAIATWAGMAGFAVGIGPVAGGWLLDHFSWHAVFWMNIPIALLVLVGTVVLVPESRAARVGGLDVVGAALSLLGVTTLVWTIIEAPNHGWLSVPSLLGYAAAAVLLASFVWWELHHPAPVFDVALLRIRRFAFPALAITVGYFSLFGFLFLITQYFQGVREYTPLQYGVHSLPFALSVVLFAPAATLIAQRLGTTAILVVGLLVLGAGMFLAGRVTVDSPYLGIVVVSMMLFGFGFALVQGPATESIMSSVPPDQAGAGSALNDTTREIGGALGVAILGSIVSSVYTPKVSPLVDAIPDSVMTPTQKGYARESVLTVLQIQKQPLSPLFDTRKHELIHAMKAALLDGVQVASYATVGAVVLCALVVALFLPWRPAAGSSLLLGWATDAEPPQTTDAAELTTEPPEQTNTPPSAPVRHGGVSEAP